MLIEAGSVAFSIACFEFADEEPEEAQYDRFASLPNILASHPFDLSKVVGASSPPPFVAMLRSFQPPDQDPRTNPVLCASA